MEFLTLYLSPNIPSSSDENDAQQFIVHRSSANNNSNSVPLVGIRLEHYNKV